MRSNLPQGVYKYQNKPIRVVLIGAGVLLPLCEIGIYITASQRSNLLLIILLSLIAVGAPYVYMLLTYLNTKISITSDAIEFIGATKTTKRIPFNEVTSITFRTPGKEGPLAVIRSENSKVAIQKGINDWPRLKEALESLQSS